MTGFIKTAPGKDMLPESLPETAGNMLSGVLSPPCAVPAIWLFGSHAAKNHKLDIGAERSTDPPVWDLGAAVKPDPDRQAPTSARIAGRRLRYLGAWDVHEKAGALEDPPEKRLRGKLRLPSSVMPWGSS